MQASPTYHHMVTVVRQLAHPYWLDELFNWLLPTLSSVSCKTLLKFWKRVGEEKFELRLFELFISKHRYSIELIVLAHIALIFC